MNFSHLQKNIKSNYTKATSLKYTNQLQIHLKNKLLGGRFKISETPKHQKKN